MNEQSTYKTLDVAETLNSNRFVQTMTAVDSGKNEGVQLEDFCDNDYFTRLVQLIHASVANFNEQNIEVAVENVNMITSFFSIYGNDIISNKINANAIADNICENFYDKMIYDVICGEDRQLIEVFIPNIHALVLFNPIPLVFAYNTFVLAFLDLISSYDGIHGTQLVLTLQVLIENNNQFDINAFIEKFPTFGESVCRISKPDLLVDICKSIVKLFDELIPFYRNILNLLNDYQFDISLHKLTRLCINMIKKDPEIGNMMLDKDIAKLLLSIPQNDCDNMDYNRDRAKFVTAFLHYTRDKIGEQHRCFLVKNVNGFNFNEALKLLSDEKDSVIFINMISEFTYNDELLNEHLFNHYEVKDLIENLLELVEENQFDVKLAVLQCINKIVDARNNLFNRKLTNSRFFEIGVDMLESDDPDIQVAYINVVYKICMFLTNDHRTKRSFYEENEEIRDAILKLVSSENENVRDIANSAVQYFDDLSYN